MKIAHFSDIHICDKFGGSAQVELILDAISDALWRGAEHFVFTGDLVENANLENFDPILEGMRKLGVSGSKDITIIPGNHDVTPIIKFESMAKSRQRSWDLCRDYSRGSFRVWSNLDLPFVKMLSKSHLLVGVDSKEYVTAGRFRPASGFVSPATMERIEEVLECDEYARVKRKILAIHHPPLELARLNDSIFSPDWQLTNRDEVRDFCKRVGFDLILSGHWHNSGSASLKHRIGQGRLVLSASNMSETSREVVYTLIDVPSRGSMRMRRYCL